MIREFNIGYVINETEVIVGLSDKFVRTQPLEQDQIEWLSRERKCSCSRCQSPPGIQVYCEYCHMRDLLLDIEKLKKMKEEFSLSIRGIENELLDREKDGDGATLASILYILQDHAIRKREIEKEY